MASALRSRYRKAKVTTVINRTDRRSEIGQQDVERAVGGAIAHQFPSDYRRALHAMHKGRPLALDNHNDLVGLVQGARPGAGGCRNPSGRRSGHRVDGSPRRTPILSGMDIHGGFHAMNLTTAPVDTRNASYQELKSRIHQELLNRLNLDRLTRVKREDAEPEIRA